MCISVVENLLYFPHPLLHLHFIICKHTVKNYCKFLYQMICNIVFKDCEKKK